jgi:preprotein translocase subunit Sec61beta
MSKKKKESAPSMPASSAGLIRFFQDEAYGIKIRPEFVLGGAIALVLSVIEFVLGGAIALVLSVIAAHILL